MFRALVVWVAFMAWLLNRDAVPRFGSGGGGCARGRAWTLRSRSVVTPAGVIPADVHVVDGRIAAVVTTGAGVSPSGSVVDVGSAVVSPGLVDIHAHLNDPSAPPRVDWEGFDTGTRAAAAGGVTSVVDMPLNSVPTTITRATFDLKLAAARERGLASDVAFWGGLVPENAHNPSELASIIEGGAIGLKAFISPSGCDDFGNVSLENLEAGAKTLAGLNAPLMAHCELPEPGTTPPDDATLDPRKYSTYQRTRPRVWERRAIAALTEIANRTSVRAHIAHLSDADSLAYIAQAKASGAPITVETCTHYLAFAAEEIPDGDTRFKCAPPIREAENRERLWRALKAGVIDLVSSDHSPAPAASKHLDTGNFLKAWGGIASLQLSLPATWAEASKRGASLVELANWWSTAPAAVAGLQYKGSIAPGKDADFVVWDPEAVYVVPPADQLQHRHAVTAFEGRALRGRVLATFVRGAKVFDVAAPAGDQFALCGAPLLRRADGSVHAS